MSMSEKQAINIPVWAGIAAIVLGGGLLLLSGRKTQASAPTNAWGCARH
jgi:hypothetical protein